MSLEAADQVWRLPGGLHCIGVQVTRGQHLGRLLQRQEQPSAVAELVGLQER